MAGMKIENRSAQTAPQRSPQKQWRARRPMSEQEGTDKFYIPPEIVPEGMTWEWKRYSTIGEEDITHMVQMKRDGAWDPVSHDQWTERLGEFGKPGQAIVLDGMILMQRPAEYSEEARKEELAKAKGQVTNHFKSFTNDKGGPPKMKPEVRAKYDTQLVPSDDDGSTE